MIEGTAFKVPPKFIEVFSTFESTQRNFTEKVALGPQLLRDGNEFDSVKKIPSKIKSMHEGKIKGTFRMEYMI